MIVYKTKMFVLAALILIGIGSNSFADDMPVIRLAYSRVIDDLPFYVGVEEKFFEKEGVRLELVRLTGANNILAAVIRNDLQAGLISTSQVFPAAQQSVPIKIVAWLGKAHSGTHCGLHVKKDGDIRGLQDLRGKKIALSNDNMNRMIVSEALNKKGLTNRDADLILGMALDDPMQHEAVLKSGRVDVIIA
jgi:NitT/TauT family transport system substrate-binding protein